MENNLHLDQHISKRYNEELTSVHHQALKMGGLVEAQLNSGITSLLQANLNLANQVILDDSLVNQMELDIDETCIEILARRQPTASDLRLIIAILKSISDLERIGDLAQRLGKESKHLSQSDSDVLQVIDLQHLADLTQAILRSSLNSFVRLDHESALDAITQDRAINKEYHKVSKNLIDYMAKNPHDVENILRVGDAARSLERIGDHSKNICEYVIYLVKGEDIRYRNIDEVRNELL